MNPSEKAVLAGGCFWGMQDLVRKLPGVLRTRVGYSGGDVPNATYRNHGTHAEALEVEFDPTQTSFRDLLEFFFQIHDPSTPGRQGNDRGSSYRSAIFYTSDEQLATAQQTPLRIVLGADATPEAARASLARAVQRRGIAQLQAVKEGRAYAMLHHFYNSPFNVVAVQVFAKWLHPALFADLDPRATLQTMYERFQPIPLEGVYWTALKP